MEEYTEVLADYLKENRKYKKIIYKICGTLYRGVTKGRFSLEEGLEAVNKL